MITDKIKSLFNFIEFLHSNIDNFKSYNELIVELEFLKTEKNKLNPKDNYKDKLKFNELQKELESKFKLLQDNTANPIKAKAKELDVCNFDNEPNYSFNGVEDEIYQLKEEFKIEDLAEINKHKIQYLEYRNQAHKTFLSLSFFFNDLDRILKDFFDFFKDNKQNEFEAFETKTIIINNQSKAFELYSKGYKEFKFEVIENYSLPDLSNCVFDLTLQNLVDCGLSEKHTSELLENKGKYTLQCNEGNFFVSAEDNKVYTGIEFYRKTYFYNGKLYFPYNCPAIIPDYFDLALNEFKQKQAELLGSIYNDSDAFDEFIKDETNKTQTRIEAQKEYLLKHKHHKFESKENDIKVCEAYIQYLKRKKDEVKQPQQIETIKTDRVKNEHPKFNPNYWNKECFELFKYLFDEYYKGTKREITNIWFYLKEYQNRSYILNATKDLYIDFINENYQIKITNFDKAQQKWEDKEYKKIDEHRQNFEDELK